MRNRAASAGAAVVAFATLALATSGFRAFTAEGVRRLEVERAPRAVPGVVLEDALGRAFRFSELRGRRVAVSFVYTRCPSVCVRLTGEFDALSVRLRGSGARGRVALLTVSFDPAYDSAEQLRAYAGLHAADGELWRFARMREPGELARWLDAFGVVVVPDGRGGFVHNAAIHLVDERGRLSRIVDVAALDAAERFLTGDTGS